VVDRRRAKPASATRSVKLAGSGTDADPGAKTAMQPLAHSVLPEMLLTGTKTSPLTGSTETE
jgi:hypothetical protein